MDVHGADEKIYRPYIAARSYRGTVLIASASGCESDRTEGSSGALVHMHYNKSFRYTIKDRR